VKPVLEVSGLKKTFRESIACQVDNLQVGAGERLALVGPSGAGKTTFLRLVNGLEQPDAGEIFVKSGSGKRDRGVMVFQRPHLFSGSVYYNIAYGLKLRKYPANLVEERVAKAAVQVGLEHALGWNVATLSAGEAQRVSLARALAVRPRLLLLDEPTANLDPGNVRVIEEVLQGLFEVTILLVSHNLAQARRMARRILFFNSGHLEIDVPAQDFFRASLSSAHGLFLEGEMP
jgi:tungstate transport system ATP-binding protein